jgi:NADP-dependent 3-hydroxy acid dehydrogenase YdfG
MAPTVLITGASQGICKATTLLFSRHGYNLVLAARQPDRLETLAAILQKVNHAVLAVSTDVTDAEQVKKLVDQAIAHFGTVDVLVNNRLYRQ